MAAMGSLCTSATLSALLFTLLIHAGHSFYLPGSYPPRYRPGEALAAKVNSLTSPTSKLPYPYYSLPFCAPQDGVRRAAESLGELLLGDRIETSPYRFHMLNSTGPLFLCRTDPVSSAAAQLIRSRIDDAYQVNLLLDTLPAVRYVKSGEVLFRSTGFPLGVRADDGEYYVYNHLKFTVLVNRQNATTKVETLMATADGAELISFSRDGGKGAGGYTVVGFEVVPCSVDYDDVIKGSKAMYDEMPAKATTGCDPSVVGMRVREDRPLAFSYEVAFAESAVEWPSRWDAYLDDAGGGGGGSARVHWFSILNSIVVVAFLAAIVVVILLRTVRRDLARYEDELGGAESGTDQLAGWKLVAGDVFREPARPLLLCVLVGDGVRILGMGVVTILFAALGFMSPASRGALVTGMLCFYIVLGAAAGYASVSLWKTVRRGDAAGWSSVAWAASLAFPGAGLAVFTVLNCVLWYNGSTGAVPFALFALVILLWFFVSVPLTLAGGLAASRAHHVEFPVKPNKVARQVPALPGQWCSPWLFVAAAGTLPFGTLFIELFFIMSSLWLGRVYYVFGFLLVVLALLVAVCAEVSVVLTYMGLCVEDWRWWWRAFFASGSVALYVLAYAVYYLIFDLHSLAGPVSAALYVGYSLLMALAVMLATGTVGLGASFCFVYYLFSTVKLD